MRRLLFLTYYFPPSAGPGVQRALKFARYLPEHGWDPTVVTVRPEDAAYPDLDPAMATEVPPSLRVERTGAWDPYALYARLQGKQKADTVNVGFLGEAQMTWQQQLARWLRANVFLPDARVGWVPFAVRRGAALLQEGGYDALYTTGPPHSAHLAGRYLARRYGLPWVADLRDPWTGIDYAADLPMTAPARALDAALERSVLGHADAVVSVSRAMARGLAPRVTHRNMVIENGFDPDDFALDAFTADAVADAAPLPPEDFVLAYVGNMNAARNPEVLWRALAQLDAPLLRLHWTGNVEPQIVAQARTAGSWTHDAYVPHAEAVRRMRRSTLLLLVINRVDGAEGITTGKLYEYVASGRPILAIGPPQGDAAAVLRATGAGEMFDYADVEGVTAFVRRHYAAWAAGAPLPGAAGADAAPYSRRAQAGALAQLLTDVSARP